MGLFDIFRKKKEQQDNSPEIPKDTFIEEVNGKSNGQSNGTNHVYGKGIDAIHAFLQKDFENQGYSDALTNADDAYKQENLEHLQCQLEIKIREAKQHYREALSKIDHLIQLNSRQGMVDHVRELELNKALALEQVESVKEIEKGMENKEGISRTITLSYNRGFSRGIAAVTKSITSTLNL